MRAGTDIIEHLDRHQKSILDHLGAAHRLLDQRSAENAAALDGARDELVRAIGAYQLFKHSSVFYPLINGTDQVAAERARQLKAACLRAGEDLRAYSARWKSADLLRQWDDYVIAARGRIAEIRVTLGRERGEIAALSATLARLGQDGPRGYGSPSIRRAAPVRF